MIDINLLRENPAQFINLIKYRGNPEKANIKRWLNLDEKRKYLIQQRDLLNKEKNNLASIGKNSPDLVREKGKEIKQKIEYLEKDLKIVESEWKEILDWIPNLFLDDVPIGNTEEDNVEIKVWTKQNGYLEKDKIGTNKKSIKYMPKYPSNSDKEFTPRPHWELGKELNLINIEQASKTSGSRFYYITGDGAMLIYGAFNLLFKKLLEEKFNPIIVPLLVKEKILYGSSHFPADADQVYKIENKYLENDKESLYLIGSSEPSNFAYFMDTVLEEKDFPIKIMAQTPCFRSEVGSWGKDVRGIKRSHQFDKLEMNIIIQADIEKAKEMHEYLLSINEWLLQTLEIPYRVINMCTADLGYYAAAKKYDVEFWAPSQNTYIELMSNSITTDYQSRRLNIRYKDKNGNLKYVYTLNDTGITHRILIAILEHYQQIDGSVKVPKALVDFVGKTKITKQSN